MRRMEGTSPVPALLSSVVVGPAKEASTSRSISRHSVWSPELEVTRSQRRPLMHPAFSQGSYSVELFMLALKILVEKLSQEGLVVGWLVGREGGGD